MNGVSHGSIQARASDVVAVRGDVSSNARRFCVTVSVGALGLQRGALAGSDQLQATAQRSGTVTVVSSAGKRARRCTAPLPSPRSSKFIGVTHTSRAQSLAARHASARSRWCT